MKICVTGGYGYIGSKLVQKLAKLNHQITIVDNLYFKQTKTFNTLYSLQNINGYMVDVKHFGHWGKYDAIIHLAAYVGAPLCNKLENREVIRLNRDFVKDLVSKLSQSQKLIFPNTNSSYGNSTDEICTEESERNPLSLYADTKDNAEKIVTDFGGLAFRLATVCGISPRPRFDLLVNDFCYKAFKDKRLEVYEPHYRRNFVDVEDVTDAFIWGLGEYNRVAGQSYNLGMDSSNMTKGELAQKVCKEFDASYIIGHGNDPDHRNYLISSDKLAAAGFKARVPVETSINNVKGWLEKNSVEPWMYNVVHYS